MKEIIHDILPEWISGSKGSKRSWRHTKAVLAGWTRHSSPESQPKHPVLGLAGIHILRVRVGLALTYTRRQTCFIPIFGRTFAKVDKCMRLREALLDLKLDMSAHVLRLIGLNHKSRVWWEIQRPSRFMSTRGFDERDSAELFLNVDIEAKPRNFPICRYQAGPSVPDADKIRFHCSR